MPTYTSVQSPGGLLFIPVDCLKNKSGKPIDFQRFHHTEQVEQKQRHEKNHSGGISAELKYRRLRYGLFFAIYLDVLPPKFAGRI